MHKLLAQQDLVSYIRLGLTLLTQLGTQCVDAKQLKAILHPELVVPEEDLIPEEHLKSNKQNTKTFCFCVLFKFRTINEKNYIAINSVISVARL